MRIENQTTTYKGCKIYRSKSVGGLLVWDDEIYGAESDTAFKTVEAAKLDIDRFFGAGPAPRLVSGELVA